MKKLFWLILLTTFVSLGFGLVSDYSYSSGNEAYTEITGGTVISTGTIDDTGYTVTLPIAFTFNENAVTTVLFSANGQIGMNGTYGSYSPISSTATGIGLAAILGADLQGNTTGEMRWEALGTAPNRQIVFQWKNWTTYQQTSYPAQFWGLQVILFETSNYIKFKYNNFNPTTYVGTTQVGLRGATNADFKNRMTATDWAATTPGGSNTATCSLSSTIYPANGQYFQFNPPIAAFPPNPAVLVSPLMDATGVVLNTPLMWSNGGGMPLGYKVKLNTFTPPTTQVADVAGTSYTPTTLLLPNQDYYWQIIPHNTNGDATGCPIWHFMTGTGLAVNMMNGSMSVPNGVNVNFYDSGGPSATYQNNESYTYTFTPADPTRKIQSMFNSFTSESGWDYMYIYDGPSTASTLLGTYNGTVTIPTFISTDVTGALTFRFTSDTSVTYAGWDAVISSIAVSSPPNPAILVSPALGATGLNINVPLHWANGGGIPDGYYLNVGTNAAANNFYNMLNVGNVLTFPLSGLAWNQTYNWQIIPYNTYGNATGCPIWTFSTMPDPSITTFPYVQSFDTWPPVAWDLTGGTFSWGQYGADWAYANFWSQTEGNTAYMMTPPIYSTSDLTCTFLWSHQYMSSYPNDALYLQYSTDGSTWNNAWSLAGAAFESADGATSTAPGTGVIQNVNLGAFGLSSTTFWLRFYGYSGYGPDVFLDDFSLHVPVFLPPGPAALLAPVDGAIDQEPFTVNLDWVEPTTGGIADGYGIVIGTNADVYNSYDYYYEVMAPATASSPYTDQGIVLTYNTRWFWGIIPFNAYGSPDTATLPVFSFFTPVSENMGPNILLTGHNIGLNNVQLDWTRFPIDGSLNYDSGINNDGIGTGAAAVFDVAAKFPTSILAFYAGQYLTTVRIFPREATATYTLEVWSGDDANLAPTTLIYSLPITPTIGVWNDIVIPGILITGTQALWIGYGVNATTGYPAGCDAGPYSPEGQLINWSGTWTYLVNLNATLTFNWNIQGLVTATPANRELAQLISIPVTNTTFQKTQSIAFTSDPRTPPAAQERLLQGYKVWRGATLLTPVPIAALTFLDSGVADGTYNYQIEGVYYTGSTWSNVWTTTVSSAPPLPIPFLETWPTADFNVNYWSYGTNWYANAGSAYFGWSPQILNYDTSLTSHNIDCTGASTVRLRYDLYYSNYSSATLEEFEVELYVGGSWINIQHYDNVGGSLPWMRHVHDISALAAGQTIKFRFRAHGQDSYNTNDWDFTNVLVDIIPTPSAPVVTTTTPGTIDWSTSYDPYVDFYKMDYSSDPYGTIWTNYGWAVGSSYYVDPAILPNPLFWKVTAINGENPH